MTTPQRLQKIEADIALLLEQAGNLAAAIGRLLVAGDSRFTDLEQQGAARLDRIEEKLDRLLSLGGLDD